MRANLICGGILLLVAAVFWLQRDFDDPLAGAFPDLVLIVLAVMAVGIIGLGIRQGMGQGAGQGGRTDSVPATDRRIDLRVLATVAALVVFWAVAVGLIGFTITGIVAFVLMALLVRRGRPRLRVLAQDVAVAAVVVVACFFVFTRGLLVPLPVSTLIGM